MSRHGYTDDWDCSESEAMLATANLDRAINGARGQKLLRDLLAALDAMPVKRLIAEALEITPEDIEKDRAKAAAMGSLGWWTPPTVGVCALGCVGKARGIDLAAIDPEEPCQVAKAFGIAENLARHIAYLNDDSYWNMSMPNCDEDERRWRTVRAWVASHVKDPQP